MAAALAIFGAVDSVFVFMAIKWFRTQHPQPVFEKGTDQLFRVSPPMLYTILVNFAAFLVFGGIVIWMRYRLERARQQFEEEQAMESLAVRSMQ
jgi:heme exporter protein C